MTAKQLHACQHLTGSIQLALILGLCPSQAELSGTSTALSGTMPTDVQIYDMRGS